MLGRWRAILLPSVLLLLSSKIFTRISDHIRLPSVRLAAKIGITAVISNSIMQRIFMQCQICEDETIHFIPRLGRTISLY